MNILNSESSGSNLNISKPSYYQDYLNQDESLINRGASNSHKFYSSKYQTRLLDQLHDRTYEKLNTSYYQDTKMQTIQQLQNQVEKLVEELRTQIHINKDILFENEKLQIKYRRLKQMVLEYIQNDETDTERIFNNYNSTIEKLVSQQQKLKEALVNSEKKKYVDANKLYDERTLEEQFQRIKKENTELKQKISRGRNDQNKINKYDKEERIRTPSKNKDKNKLKDPKIILSQLMNKENLDRLSKEISNLRYENSEQNAHFFQNKNDFHDENVYKYREKSKKDSYKSSTSQNKKYTPKKQQQKQDYQTNNAKAQVLQNLYSFGYRSPHNTSQNSEDQIEDLVNYNTKINKNTSYFPLKQLVNDKYINKSSSSNNLQTLKTYHQ